MSSQEPSNGAPQQTTSTETTTTQTPSTEQAPSTNSWIPESFRNDPQIKDFNPTDPSGLINSYKILNERKGRSVLIPTENAGKEEMDKFYSRLTSIDGVTRTPDSSDADSVNQFWQKQGKPENATSYTSDFGELTQYVDPNTINSFKEFAFENNLTSEQFKAVIDFDLKRSKQYHESTRESAHEGVQILKEKWGSEYHNRAASVKAALRVYKDQFPKHFKLLESMGENNPAVAQLLSDAGQSLQQKGLIKEPYARQGNTPEVAQQKIDEMRANKSHPLHDPSNRVAYQKAKKEMNQLYLDREGG